MDAFRGACGEANRMLVTKELPHDVAFLAFGSIHCGVSPAEDPGLSAAREAAEAVTAESVRLERKSARSGINLSIIFI